MKKYNITFKIIQQEKDICERNKKLLQIKAYDTLIKVYDLIEDLKCHKASNIELVKSIRMWIAAYNRVRENFVANQLFNFLKKCEVKE